MSEGQRRLELVLAPSREAPNIYINGPDSFALTRVPETVCGRDKQSQLIGRDGVTKLLKRPLVALIPVSETTTSMSH
jgi:hypothetical protein